MDRLRPFFSYYGAKHRLAAIYPRPALPDIIEPFAGAAGYSLLHYQARVHLNDASPVVAGVWDYLIKAKPEEVRALPLLFDDVRTLAVPQEARWLIGFWVSKGSATPKHRPSRYMRERQAPRTEWSATAARVGSYWDIETRDRIASQVDRIRHWRVTPYSYDQIENSAASWFIDPPYMGQAGALYPCGSGNINYVALSEWCKSRAGQVIVCEGKGAHWLPFRPLIEAKGQRGSYAETIWP